MQKNMLNIEHVTKESPVVGDTVLQCINHGCVAKITLKNFKNSHYYRIPTPHRKGFVRFPRLKTGGCKRTS